MSSDSNLPLLDTSMIPESYLSSGGCTLKLPKGHFTLLGLTCRWRRPESGRRSATLSPIPNETS
jgi:hypothetical protein